MSKIWQDFNLPSKGIMRPESSVLDKIVDGWWLEATFIYRFDVFIYMPIAKSIVCFGYIFSGGWSVICIFLQVGYNGAFSEPQS